MMLTTLSQQDQRVLRKQLKGIEIHVTHRATNKLESFKGFTPRSAQETEFTLRDGRTLTIAQYFLEKYNFDFSIRTCPALSSVPEERGPNGVLHRRPHQADPGHEPDPTQSADQIKHSALRPDARRQRVDEIRREVAYDNDPMLGRWGITVNQQPLQAEARVIAPPSVSYAPGSQQPRVNFGAWNS